MVFRTFLLKYGEIGIKGKNRGQFEDALAAQVRHALEKVEGDFEVTKEQGRIYVNVLGEDDSFDADEVTAALQKVFGLVGICQVLKAPVADPEQIAEDAIRYIAKTYGLTPAGAEESTAMEVSSGQEVLTFKVHTRRANKQYPLNSMEVDALVGEQLLAAYPGKMKVDVHQPDIMVYIEIREEVFIYSKIVPGPGGMPVGTNGRAQLLLSGGQKHAALANLGIITVFQGGDERVGRDHLGRIHDLFVTGLRLREADVFLDGLFSCLIVCHSSSSKKKGLPGMERPCRD